MKTILLLLLSNITVTCFSYGQDNAPDHNQQKAIASLIDQYSQAREKSDTVLLKAILTTDVDQLVSTGEWRNGIGVAVQGMLKSSSNNPGTRTLVIDKIRRITTTTAIVDCKYEILNTNSTIRKMWSSFVVIADKKVWKISAI